MCYFFVKDHFLVFLTKIHSQLVFLIKIRKLYNYPSFASFDIFYQQEVNYFTQVHKISTGSTSMKWGTSTSTKSMKWGTSKSDILLEA